MLNKFGFCPNGLIIELNEPELSSPELELDSEKSAFISKESDLCLCFFFGFPGLMIFTSISLFFSLGIKILLSFYLLYLSNFGFYYYY